MFLAMQPLAIDESSAPVWNLTCRILADSSSVLESRPEWAGLEQVLGLSHSCFMPFGI
jgi:hypothetical protein